jgi:poly(hydroxyalkanoate) depolymerase family esterase
MSRRTVLGAVAVSMIAGLLVGPKAEARQKPGTFERYTYTSQAGTYDYMLYVPRPASHDKRLPLIVSIPGAAATAEQDAHDSDFNTVAARAGFFVLYPEPNIEEYGYFHYDDDVNQHRGSGEASVIAGMTQTVMKQWRIDRRRVYVGGISNGGAMANVMMTTYPDLFAALLSHSGGPYKCQGGAINGCTVTPEDSARAVIKEMGPRGRVVPFIVFHGVDDKTVPQASSDHVVTTWQLVADRFDDGRSNGSIPMKPRAVLRFAPPGKHSYKVFLYVDGKGRPLGEYWLIDGMRHAYSGGPANTPQGLCVDPNSKRKFSACGTDPLGPHASWAAYRFFLAHPNPRAA